MRTRSTELAELVEAGALQIVSALGAACEEGLSVPQLTELLRVALRKRNQIEAAVTRTIGEVDAAAEQAKEVGELTMGLACATWLAFELHISSSAAHAQVRLARQLPSMPATRAAFERGELSPQHAGVISRSVERVARGGADAGLAEQILLHEADKRDPRDLLRYGLSLLHRLAPREMEAEEERRHRHRFLRLAEMFDGGYQLEGYLDEVAGARLKTALDGVMGHRARGEERTPGQRRADALDEIVTRMLDSGQLPVRGGQRPHLTITASLETLRADPGAPAALLNWGLPISGQGAAPDRRRRRAHPDPRQRLGRPAARGPQVPHRHPEDAQGAGRAGPALRMAGLCPAARLDAGRPHQALGAGRRDRHREHAIAVRCAQPAPDAGLAAGAAAGPEVCSPPAGGLGPAGDPPAVGPGCGHAVLISNREPGVGTSPGRAGRAPLAQQAAQQLLHHPCRLVVRQAGTGPEVLPRAPARRD